MFEGKLLGEVGEIESEKDNDVDLRANFKKKKKLSRKARIRKKIEQSISSCETETQPLRNDDQTEMIVIENCKEDQIEESELVKEMANLSTLSTVSDTGVISLSHTATMKVKLTDFSTYCREKTKLGSDSKDKEIFFQRGMVNIRNNCFRNAVLQALFSLPPFLNLMQHLRSQFGNKEAITTLHQTGYIFWAEIIQFAIQFYSNDINVIDGSINNNNSSISNRISSIVSIKKDVSKEGEISRNKKSISTMPSSSSETKNYSSTLPLNPKNIHSGSNSKKSSSTSFLSPIIVEDNLPVLLNQFQQLMATENSDTSTDPSQTFIIIGNDINKNNTRNNYNNTSGSTVGQQDAMEFMTYLLDSLHEEEINQITSKQELSEFQVELQHEHDTFFSTSEVAVEDDWLEVSHKRNVTVDKNSKKNAIQGIDATVISRLFHGYLRSELRSTSKRATVSTTFQRFHCLTLTVFGPGPLRSPSTPLTVEDAIHNYFKEEDLYDSKSKKRISLEHCPPVLILQLNRFAFDTRHCTTMKVESEVAYGHNLELGIDVLSLELRMKLDFIAKSHGDLSTSSPTLRYRLEAVVLHHGSKASGGHYTTIGRDSSGIWRHFDDSHVTVVSANQALDGRKQAYLLFYCREN